ncbi:HAF repeat-containing protein [Amycolatopsis umgeniensis]|uniref:Putative HAF family extracellular repeat protein n=1 Tax=Amycolatopsis umgeniensis TaxID=336628 RepID=A0A841AUE6_9PSEU|nr:HAF repeat-containing protein [Amycolatopsis umgeniensis]MBB5849952.1 putative HAF family extracellular repeat protein [Amycolatopsis umgeniensis]
MLRNRVAGVRRPALSLTAALVVLACAVTGTAQATQTGPVDLGTLPGDDASTVLAVNEAGVMVGLSFAGPARRSLPVRWDANGQIMALPTPGGTEGQVRDINSLGVSAGYVLTPTAAVPVRWDADGVATTLQVPPGYHNATAWAISDTGVVVGNWLTPDNHYHGFRWDPNGQATDLGALPGETWSMADGISADGSIIVGSGFRAGANQAVRWVNGGPITELEPTGYSSGASRNNKPGVAAGVLNETKPGPPIPATWDQAGTRHNLEWPSPHSVWVSQIGPTGYVVGTGYANPPKRSAVLWAPDGDLTILPDDGLGAEVEAVDSDGTAVGAFKSKATAWFRNGERRQLGLLPGGSRSQAYRITDSGRVVGTATVATGKDHAVYWTLD